MDHFALLFDLCYWTAWFAIITIMLFETFSLRVETRRLRSRREANYLRFKRVP